MPVGGNGALGGGMPGGNATTGGWCGTNGPVCVKLAEFVWLGRLGGGSN